MTTSIVDILGVDVRSAPCFAPDCYMPIVDWTKKCPPDDVVANFPVIMGSWADHTFAPALTKSQIHINTKGVKDACCDAATVRRSVEMCTLIAPNMKEIALKTETIKLCDFLDQFCRMRNVLPKQVCVFNRDGTLNPGAPFALDFYRMAVSDLAAALAQILAHASILGDDANTFEVDGLYHQIDFGWESVTTGSCPPCPQELNVGTTLDWAAMVDPACVHGGCAGPDAKTRAVTITIWGEPCDVPPGLNFAQFLEEFWFPKLTRQWTDFYGGVQAWEAHVAMGQTTCLLNAADCLKPCGTCGGGDCGGCDRGWHVNVDSNALFEQMAQSRTTKLMRLKPSGRTIPLMETNAMEKNTMRIGPRIVGGNPTYGMFFRNIAEVLDLVPLDETYGTRFGRDPYENFLAPMSRTELQNSFEEQTIFSGITRPNLRCFEAEMVMQYGVLACWRHAWLKMTNMCCCGCINCSADTGLVIDGKVLGI